MQFCLARFSVINEGDSNQPWMASDATVNLGMRAYDSDSAPAPGYNPEAAYMQQAQPAVKTSDFGINPGVHAVNWGVWEILAGSHATSASVEGSSTGDATASTSPVVLILLGGSS